MSHKTEDLSQKIKKLSTSPSDLIQFVKITFKNNRSLIPIVNYLQDHPKVLNNLSKHITRYIKTFKNPVLLQSLEQLYITLQEDAVPNTCEYIFLLHSRLNNIKNINDDGL